MENRFTIKCPECNVENQLLQPPQPGKKYRCGKCGAVITIPQTAGVKGATAEVPEDKASRKFRNQAKWIQRARTGNRIRFFGYGFIAVIILVVFIFVFTLPPEETQPAPPTAAQTPAGKPAPSPTQTAAPSQAKPTIAVSPNDLRFTVSEGEFSVLTGVLHISNSGSGTLNWTVLSGFYNVTLSPTSGSSTGEASTVNVSVDIEGLGVGNHDAAINIYAEDASKVHETVSIEISIIKNQAYVYEDGYIHVGGNGEPIELINNPGATNPTYAELVAFIDEDATNTLAYVAEGLEAHISADFAEEVHNNAEASGISAAWVSIDFKGDEEGYALNAFETTDRGLIYIDCTGHTSRRLSKPKDTLDIIPQDTVSIVSPSARVSWDTVAYIKPDGVYEWIDEEYVWIELEYGRIEVEYAKAFSYDFYKEYKQKWQEYESLINDYNAEVTQFNLEIEENVYEADSQELAIVEAWEERLEREMRFLEELKKELSDFWIKPLGIVEDIYIRW